MKIYDADQVSITFGGVLIESGYADGQFLSIEWDNPQFSDVAGTDGEVTRSKSNDRRATITVSLMQTSDGNAQLAAIAARDRLEPNGAGVAALQVNDRNGNSLYEAAAAWISQTPNVTFDREATQRDWTIRCENLIDTTGGT